MATHQLAKGLASLGKHGDSMLMHVSPSEVAGLQQLGKMTGHKLHTNPHTGMPEAFDFGDFLSNLLPTAVAIALAPETGGASLTTLPETMAANVATTAATNAATNIAMAPIIGGMATGAAVAGAKGQDPLMGGLMGGISGYGAQGLSKAFNNMAGMTPTADMGTTALKDSAGNVVEQIKSAGMDAIPQGASTELYSAPGVVGDVVRTGVPNQALAANSGVSNLLGSAGTNLGNVASGLGDFAKNPFDTYSKFTSPAVGGSGMQLATTFGLPALSAMQPEPFDMAAEEEKRKAEENKYRDPITGKLNLLQASPGLRLATGGTINTNQSTVSNGGLQDLYGSNDNTTGSALSQDGYGIGRLNALAAAGSKAKAADTFYAAGGPIAFAEGGSSYIHIPGYNDPVVSQGSLGNLGPMGLLAVLFGRNPALLNTLMNKSTPTTAAPAARPAAPTTIDPLNAPGMYPQAADNYMASKPTDKGTFALQAAKGGYLDGAGDGMSDSIPGTIEGKQPARLADGEFVIPADVVSHLGNGSSKAGSQRLYSMLDKVRKARTGHTKQGKEINPNKYMPA